MPALTSALIGAALGAGKYALDQSSADKQRAAAAENNKYSPWTKMTMEMPKNPSLGNDLLQGGATGLLMGMKSGAGGDSGAEDEDGLDTDNIAAVNRVKNSLADGPLATNKNIGNSIAKISSWGK